MEEKEPKALKSFSIILCCLINIDIDVDVIIYDNSLDNFVFFFFDFHNSKNSKMILKLNKKARVRILFFYRTSKLTHFTNLMRI